MIESVMNHLVRTAFLSDTHHGFVPRPSLSLRRRSYWSDLAGLQCVDGIPHDRGPCTAVPSHLGADHWSLPVPSSSALDPRSSWMVLDQIFSWPQRFRQVGNRSGQMTSRMISPGARLKAGPNQRRRR